jgi:hypothetical protein
MSTIHAKNWMPYKIQSSRCVCVCVCVCVCRERRESEYRDYKPDVSGTLSWSKVIYFLIFDVRMKYIYLTLSICCSLQIRWFSNIEIDISDFMYSCTYVRLRLLLLLCRFMLFVQIWKLIHWSCNENVQLCCVKRKQSSREIIMLRVGLVVMLDRHSTLRIDPVRMRPLV